MEDAILATDLAWSVSTPRVQAVLAVLLTDNPKMGFQALAFAELRQ